MTFPVTIMNVNGSELVTVQLPDERKTLSPARNMAYAALELCNNSPVLGVKPLPKIFGANLRGSDFSGMDLQKKYMTNCDLSRSSFKGANMYGLSLSGSNLFQVSFQDANMQWVNLMNTILSGGVNFQGAELNSTGFNQVSATENDFTGARYGRYILDGKCLAQSTCAEESLALFKTTTKEFLVVNRMGYHYTLDDYQAKQASNLWGYKASVHARVKAMVDYLESISKL